MSFELATPRQRPARELHADLRRALDDLSRAHRGAVLCFAEILERRLYRELGHPTIHHYAAGALGFSPSRTAQFVRLAEALNRLPLLREAVAAQRLGWTKAVVVASVATPRTEALWLAEAQRLSRPELARRASAARALAREQQSARLLAESTRPVLLPPCPPPRAPALDAPLRAPAAMPAAVPAAVPAAAPALTERAAAAAASLIPDDPLLRAAAADLPVHVSLRFTPPQYARFAAQVERLRKLGARGAAALPPGADREELVLAALDELIAAATVTAAAASPAAAGRSAPRATATVSPYLIVIHRCEECGRSTVRAPEGPRPLPAPAAAAMACDGREVRPDGVIANALPPSLRRRVMARDGWRCQAAGCGSERFLEVHHRVPRAAGGGDDPANLVTLCAACHRLWHERGSPTPARAPTTTAAAASPGVSARGSP